MNCTTIEQSKALIEAGLNPDSADMCYLKSIIPAKGCCRWREEWDKFPVMVANVEFEDILPEPEAYPCWSTGALIEAIPKYIEDNEGIGYSLKMEFAPGGEIIQYERVSSVYSIYYHNFCGQGNFIESLINVIFWLLKNGFIKKIEK